MWFLWEFDWLLFWSNNCRLKLSWWDHVRKVLRVSICVSGIKCLDNFLCYLCVFLIINFEAFWSWCTVYHYLRVNLPLAPALRPQWLRPLLQRQEQQSLSFTWGVKYIEFKWIAIEAVALSTVIFTGYWSVGCISLFSLSRLSRFSWPLDDPWTELTNGPHSCLSHVRPSASLL